MINEIDWNEEAQKIGYFQNEVIWWANHINLIKAGDPKKQIDKIQEELDEYKEAIENGDLDHAGEELVDIFVTCIVSAEQNGIKIIDHLQPVIDKLISRQNTGKMVNGVFVKKEDL